MSGNFALVFQHCFHSSWRDRGCGLLSCKQKGQTAVPSQQDKHTLLQRGQPHAACARWRWWPRGQSSASQLLDCHSCKGQPASAWVASFQKGHFPEFIDCTYTASGVKILRSCLRKRTSLMQTHFKICLYRRTSLDIMILIKGCLCV